MVFINHTILYSVLFVVSLTIPTSSTLIVQCERAGDSFTLICPIKRESSPIQWEKHLIVYSQDNHINPRLGKKIRTRLNIVGNHRDGYYNLHIVNASLKDGGNYTCATNLNGTGVLKNVHLLVIGMCNLFIS